MWISVLSSNGNCKLGWQRNIDFALGTLVIEKEPNKSTRFVLWISSGINITEKSLNTALGCLCEAEGEAM